MDYVGLLDVSGIQSFIGASHELKEIAGRSRYIAELTATDGLYERTAAEAGVEPIVLAGGNAAFRSRGADEPLRVAFRIASRKLLEDGTGLEVVGAIIGYERGTLARSYPEALVELERRKLTQPRSTVFKLSGMERPQRVPPPQWAVSEQEYRNDLWEPLEFRRLIMRGTRQLATGRTVDDRFDLMGVVSVDGLGMGLRLITWLKRMAQESPSDDEFVERFRRWSVRLQERWGLAWDDARDAVDQAFAPAGRSYAHPVKQREEVGLARRDGAGHYLPCRLIYQGGDDMVFVADARLALSLVSVLASNLDQAPDDAEEEFRALRVSAGVVFVDSHYPFSRARELAESVRARAKRATVRRSDGDPLRAESAVSWWINRQGALEAADDHIAMKPYLLTGVPSGSDALSWPDLEERVLGGMWQSFATGRNKLKDILAAADKPLGEAGAAAVRALLASRPLARDEGQTLDWLKPTHSPDDGFDSQRATTPLLDAGELIDIHWPLKAAE
jgi:hypothetical protein